MSAHKIMDDDGNLTDRNGTPFNLKIGDRVTHAEERPNQIATVLRGAGERVVIRWEDGQIYGALPEYLRAVAVSCKPATYALDDVMEAFGVLREDLEDDTGDPWPTNPYYTFPGGHETRHISAHLTSFGGQALQYIARATRLDGNNKHDPIECLEKAGHLIQWEIQRLKDAK